MEEGGVEYIEIASCAGMRSWPEINAADITRGSYIMEPIRWEGDVAVFSTRQVDLYGEPVGIEKYFVVVEYEDRVEYGLDWKFEMERNWRNVHRYSRVERFRGVLLDLVGGRGVVPEEVLAVVKYWGIDERKKKMWNSVRYILRAYGWKKYYNKIPVILSEFGGKQDMITSEQMDRIEWKFRGLSSRFDVMRRNLKRKYFPDLRYIALRLLEEEGVEMSYDVVLLKTRRKLSEYDEIYDIIKCTL